MAEDGRGGGHHDEDRDHVRPDRAPDRVGLLEPQLLLVDPFLRDRALQVELHVRRDRGAHDRHQEQQHLGRHVESRGHEGAAHLAPVGVRQHGRRNVGDEHEGDGQEDPFHGPVAREQDESPDGSRDHGHHHDLRHAEDAQGKGRPGELGDGVGDVGDQQHRHGKDRPADAEPVPDEVRQSLAGDHSQPGHHLLDDGQDRDGDGEDPQ